MTLIATLHFLGSMLSIPILPLYFIDLGASKLELGLIMATSSIATTLLRLPLGIVSDRIGRWKMLILATLVGSLSLCLYSLAPNPTWIYPIRVLQSIPFASFGPLAISSIMDLTTPTKRGEIIGRYQTAIGLSTMGGPILCSLLLDFLDYRQIMIVASVLPAFSTIILTIGLSRGWFKDVQRQTRDHMNIGLSLEQLKVFLLRRNTLLVTYGRFSFSTALNVLMTLFAVYAVNDLGLSPSLAALLLGIRGIANTLVRIPSGMVGDKIGRKKPILLAYFMVFLAYLLISEVEDPLLIAIALGIIGFGWGMRAVSEWGVVMEEMPPEIREVANASLFVFFDIGGATGSILAGIGAETMPIPVVFKMASIMVFSGLISMTFLVSDKSEEKKESTLHNADSNHTDS